MLIDSSNVRGETDLPGARVDIQNWNDFLQSPLGGSWLPQEIVRLHKPKLQDVAVILAANSKRYCFVAFSGHGTDGHVVLNEESRRCPLSILTPIGSRGTVIADACRGREEAINFGNLTRKSAVILAEQAPVTKYASEGRTTDFSSLADSKYKVFERAWSSIRFKSAIGACKLGIVSMLSCGEGEDALENPESGGFYTSALLDAAVQFHLNTSGSGLFTTRQAHDYAEALLPAQQNPEYYPDGLAFPFAVKVTPVPVI